jgi:hypothetical protein
MQCAVTEFGTSGLSQFITSVVGHPVYITTSATSFILCLILGVITRSGEFYPMGYVRLIKWSGTVRNGRFQGMESLTNTGMGPYIH